jgi:hypothetical protein
LFAVEHDTLLHTANDLLWRLADVFHVDCLHWHRYDAPVRFHLDLVLPMCAPSCSLPRWLRRLDRYSGVLCTAYAYGAHSGHNLRQHWSGARGTRRGRTGTVGHGDSAAASAPWLPSRSGDGIAAGVDDFIFGVSLVAFGLCFPDILAAYQTCRISGSMHTVLCSLVSSNSVMVSRLLAHACHSPHACAQH